MYILLVFSLLPIILISTYIYNQDRNKEPKYILKKLLLGGFLSAILTILISFFLGNFSNIFASDFIPTSQIELLFYAFISVALIEELSKWIMLYLIGYKSIEYDEPFDILLYGAFIALGFAGIENILYVFLGGLQTALSRALTAVPLHAMLGIIMGYYLNIYKNTDKNRYKILSIIVPTLIHGTYDYFLLEETHYYISLILLVITLIYTINILNKTKTNNQKVIILKEEYCPNCGTKFELNYCPKCGRKRK